jgi:hypothetical protein
MTLAWPGPAYFGLAWPGPQLEAGPRTLLHTAHPIGTLDELVTVASGIDVHVRRHHAEKEREKKHSGVTTGTTTSQAPLLGNLFISPAAEPVAMDVDATHTHEEFIHRMRGKCFGCGLGAHTKKEGGHERDLCMHCKHVGH